MCRAHVLYAAVFGICLLVSCEVNVEEPWLLAGMLEVVFS